MPSKLPQFQSDDQVMRLMQNRWASIIDPVLAVPLNAGLLLKQVTLASGDNVVNHLLGRELQGWMLVRQRSAADIYDLQDDNKRPALTLLLNSSAPVVVDLWVF